MHCTGYMYSGDKRGCTISVPVAHARVLCCPVGRQSLSDRRQIITNHVDCVILCAMWLLLISDQIHGPGGDVPVHIHTVLLVHIIAMVLYCKLVLALYWDMVSLAYHSFC